MEIGKSIMYLYLCMYTHIHVRTHVRTHAHTQALQDIGPRLLEIELQSTQLKTVREVKIVQSMKFR